MEPRVVGILVRISDDREDERKGVDRQEKDCRERVAALGWTVGEVYSENDTSAYRRRKVKLPNGRTGFRVVRPEFRRMLDDLEAGRIQGLVAYDLDRVVRDPRDLEDLIDVAEMTQYPVRSVTGSLQLDTDADITNARVLVAMANKSSRDTARRVARAARARAEAGEFHGGHVTFGYQKSDRSAPIEPHPEHAEWVREAVRRLLAGETMYGICIDWNAQGRRTGWKRRDHHSEEATTWYPRTLKRVVTAATIAGYREYDGELYEGQWKSIVDRDDWERVRTLLNAPERKVRGFTNGNARKYELSGLVFCATCKHVMVSMTATRLRGPSFICNRLATGGCGQMRISMEHLERYIEEQVFAVVDTPELRAAIAAKGKNVDDTEKQLRAAVAKEEAALGRLTDEYDEGDLPKPEYRRRRARITERLEIAQKALADATRSRVHVALPSGGELRAQWPNKDNVWKRTILSAVIERIEISRHPAGVASNLTPRRDESERAFAVRLERHRAEVLRQRVDVQWWA